MIIEKYISLSMSLWEYVSYPISEKFNIEILNWMSSDEKRERTNKWGQNWEYFG